MDAALLDTDTISEILRRRDPQVETNSTQYLFEHSAFAYSVITHYEIVRGLLWKEALRQLVDYRRFAAKSIVVPISEAIFERAAELWVDGRRLGKPHGDADPIIAATALIHGLRLVTGNTLHFDWIPGIALLN
ncbi:MAG TPA: PIN domain-containing protein [Lacipirellulaceae bacterium]|nr:PIN domain-containing protein [Lacipirellulaceae bacterium]